MSHTTKHLGVLKLLEEQYNSYRNPNEQIIYNQLYNTEVQNKQITTQTFNKISRVQYNNIFFS